MQALMYTPEPNGSEDCVSARRWMFWVAVAAGALAAGPALAQLPLNGIPVDRGLDLQPAATEVQAQIQDFHRLILAIISAITALVLALLVWVVLRYKRSSNPTPKSFSHNTLVEVVWTVAPVLILVLIAFQSFPLLAQQERVPPVDMHLKVIGNSWYWSYEYPDLGVSIVSNMLPEDQTTGQLYRFAVDEPLLVPVGAKVGVTVTSSDVIHSWAMPSFGFKQDAIPGRINEGWFEVRQEGVYFGQCSELCGIKHAFMPIEIHAVSPQRFAAWVAEKGGDPAQFSASLQTAALVKE